MNEKKQLKKDVSNILFQTVNQGKSALEKTASVIKESTERMIEYYHAIEILEGALLVLRALDHSSEEDKAQIAQLESAIKRLKEEEND